MDSDTEQVHLTGSTQGYQALKDVVVLQGRRFQEGLLCFGGITQLCHRRHSAGIPLQVTPPSMTPYAHCSRAQLLEAAPWYPRPDIELSPQPAIELRAREDAVLLKVGRHTCAHGS